MEQKQDVIILLDSITRLARAYNLTVQASGRTLSGGLDPAALHMPKRFFGAARNMREGEALQYLQRRLLRQEARWMMLYSRNSREQAIWNLYLTESFQRREFFLP